MTGKYIPKVGDKFTMKPKELSCFYGSGVDNKVLTCIGVGGCCGGDTEIEFTGFEGYGYAPYALDSYCDFLPYMGPTTVAPNGDVEATLLERGKNYGPYKFQATISQSLKDVMRKTPGFARMSPYQQESLDMIANKLGRILNGDPNYVDSWLDIAGYAQLVVDQLNGKNT